MTDDDLRGAARRVLRFNRQSVLLGSGYLAMAAVVVIGQTLAGLHYLAVCVLTAAMLPLVWAGVLVMRNVTAVQQLAGLPGGVAPSRRAWGSTTFVLALLGLCALGPVVQQVRDDVSMRTPATAVLDGCGESGKDRSCWGHWTVDGRTYDGGDLGFGQAAGDQVAVVYAPGDPSHVRVAGDEVSALSVGAALALLGCATALVPAARKERTARRGYLAVLRLAAAGGDGTDAGADDRPR